MHFVRTITMIVVNNVWVQRVGAISDFTSVPEMLKKIENRAELAKFAEEIRAETGGDIKKKRMTVQYFLYLKDVELAELAQKVDNLSPSEYSNEITYIKMKLKSRVLAFLT